VDKYFFVHNLLSITGAFTKQPFAQKDSYAMYNGEIYNYKDCNPGYHSDGDCILDLYGEYGPRFTSRLDGEFALLVVDLSKQILIISTDVFGTKPLWLALESGNIGIASYRSSLLACGYRNIEQIKANQTIVVSLRTATILAEFKVHSFQLNQFKLCYDDWITAFSSSIKKRAGNMREKIFIGLSSGYDSGAIACELLHQNLDFNAYSIQAIENTDVLSQRLKLVPRHHLVTLRQQEYAEEKKFLKKYAEPYSTPPRPPHRPSGYVVTEDMGAVGTGVICRLAREERCKVYLSGQGSDEIMSDYGFAGQAAAGFLTTDLRGHFPSDLANVFPWTNFFEGTQQEFLYKDEVVGGAYGIECRYPFLDKAVVQEFLWLSQHLKNAYYKAPLRHYLMQSEFPFAEGLSNKVGFCAGIFGRRDRRHRVPAPTES
jgi:asparagine synthetase B (glutamine-hydrolysing)